MATATFIVTVPAGVGGGYYIDGVQKPIIPVVTGGTFRFNQNDASNVNHPVALSTTASTAGRITTGVVYYLDGVTTQANYYNLTLFNAATVRYIEITVAQTSNFFYICNVHGAGMGNVMSVTADTWGALSWNVGPWGQQNNIEFSVTGNSLNIDLDILSVEIGQQVNVTGQQQNLSLNSPNIDIAVEVFLSNNPLTGLTVEEGTLEDRTEVFPIGIQLNIPSPGIVTVTAETNAGWGRLGWGEFDWGTNTLSIEVDTTGIGLTANLGTTEAGAITIASPVGIGLTIEEGIVDPSPDAEIVGQQLSILVNSVQVDSDANALVTGIALEITQGQAELNAVTFAVLTGQQLNIALNSVVAGASAEVSPTGNQLTISVGSINVQSWQIVNTGSDVNWNIIDTAA